MIENYNDFNWKIYEDGYTGTKLIPNKSIKGNSANREGFFALFLLF